MSAVRGGISGEARQALTMNDSNHHLRIGAALLFLLLFYWTNDAAVGAAPAVSNVRALQRPGTKLVDIYNNLAHPNSPLPVCSLRGPQEAITVQFEH